MNLIDRKIVLSLNKNWKCIGVKTVRDAYTAMMGGDKNNPPVQALDISYNQNEDGSFDFDTFPSVRPVTWLEWMTLPIREYDLVINTAKMKLRVPTIVVAINYNKLPKRRFRPTLRTLYKLQDGTCGLTGQKISLNQANIEHKIPRSKGGKDTFSNLMAVGKKINSRRGNLPYEQLGLKPLFNHQEPEPVIVSHTIDYIAHNDWKFFLDMPAKDIAKA